MANLVCTSLDTMGPGDEVIDVDEADGNVKMEIRGLALTLGGRQVLQGIDLVLREGETLCIVGASGAGKSMLLRTIVRLHKATEGEVILDGDSTKSLGMEELRRRVNLVPQQPAMLEGTVEENLRFGPDLAGIPVSVLGKRIRTAMEDACLDEGFLFRRADRLSGGERQRVAIARAHAMRPEVLLLDEPTAALDPRMTHEVEKAILRLKEERGFTMMVVTHDVDQASRLGDRTVLLRRGRVVATGDSATLLDELDPEERARYMGELAKWREDGEEAMDDD
jgi:putative ABC transport system ATP-binding protein